MDRYGNIYYRRQINGKRLTVPAHTKDITLANRLHPELEYQALLKLHTKDVVLKQMSLRELIDKFINSKIFSKL